MRAKGQFWGSVITDDEVDSLLRAPGEIDYVVGASQRPVTGGDIVLLGDFQVIDDSDYLTNDSYDNRTFAENLVKVDPAL